MVSLLYEQSTIVLCPCVLASRRVEEEGANVQCHRRVDELWSSVHGRGWPNDACRYVLVIQNTVPLLVLHIYWCCEKKSAGVLPSLCMDDLRTIHCHRLPPHNMCLCALLSRLRVSVLKATHNFHTTTVVNASVDALTNSSVLANVTTVLPGTGSELEVSRYIAFCMLFMYLALLLFQLKTHTYLFEGQEEDDDEPPILGLWGAIVWLSIITVFIAFLSEFIVGALEVTYCQVCVLTVDVICIIQRRRRLRSSAWSPCGCGPIARCT